MGPLVDAVASEPHYFAHLLAVWRRLNRDERGVLWLAGALADADEPAGRPWRDVPKVGPPMLAASYNDRRAAANHGRPVIYLEHGAGQTYADPDKAPNPSYSGGPDHDGTILFLCPSETVAARWRAAYPGVPAVPVGCPRLDPLHGGLVPRVGSAPVVAVTFHADQRWILETTSAWSHFDAALPQLVADAVVRGWRLVGHAHPRLARWMMPRWRALGVETVDDLDDVLDLLVSSGGVLAADNTSALPEAASCGVPLVWLTPPWYRRHVHHGGRFWSWPAGQVECTDPADLTAAVERALVDPPEVRAARDAMVRDVYAATDGRAGSRAAAAIRHVLSPTFHQTGGAG